MHVLIVGGGAAGLLAAGTAARGGAQVTVVERGGRPAQKLRITGKGRCNVTNNCELPEFLDHVLTNPRFLFSALTAFPPQATMDLLESLSVPLKTERGRRVFPVSDKASDVADALIKFARDVGVADGARFVRGRVTALLLTDGVCRGVRLESGEEYPADAVVVCTGGLSYPRTGSTGDGYTLARQAGHTVVPPRASLVPLEAEGCAVMQGCALRNCAMRLTRGEACLYEDFGELLFTHFGLSGPVVLSASAFVRGGDCVLHIDLKPALSEAQLDARLVREFGAQANTDFVNALPALLPHKLIDTVVARSGIPPRLKCHSVTKEQRAALLAVLKDFSFPIKGLCPIEEAVITAGGVDVREVDAKTMASRIVGGLYFAGEVLDVDAVTGGYNLQIAFSTGAVAGAAAGIGNGALGCAR